MLFHKNALFSLCIFQKCSFGLKITSAQKFFWWHYFLRLHGPPGPHECAQKMGIQSIFLNVVWPLIGNIISSRFRNTLETGSENAPEMLQRSTQVQRFIYNMCMTGNSQFCTVFPVVKCLCIFVGCAFFQITYIGILFETLYSSSIKYTHKHKDT